MLQVVKRLLQQQDDDSKILAMKMAGNLGYSELAEVIEQRVKDKSAPVLQRMEAAASLQKMAREDPEKVRHFPIIMKTVLGL